MRILFVTRKYPPSMGGMEVYSEELFEALKARNPQTILYRPTPAIIGRPSVFQLLRFFVGASIAILKRHSQADVLLLGDVLLSPLALLAKFVSGGRLRVVVAAHGNDIYFASKGSIASRSYRRMVQWPRRAIDLVIANSSDITVAASKLGYRQTVRILLGTRRPVLTCSSNVTREHAILFAGRLARCKGLAWFIHDVMPLVDSDLQLLIAGPPWDASEMAAIESSSRATYLGSLSRDQLDVLRARTLANVMPNLPASISGQNEGFGLSALESAAVGTPVIVTGVGGLVEAVIDGVTGFVVPPMDAKAFAERINAVHAWSDTQRHEFSANAMHTVAKTFSWDHVANEYMVQFRSLMEGTSGGPHIT